MVIIFILIPGVPQARYTSLENQILYLELKDRWALIAKAVIK